MQSSGRRPPVALSWLLPLIALVAAVPAAAEIAAVGEPFPLDDSGGDVDLAWLPPRPGPGEPAGFLAAWFVGSPQGAIIRRTFVPQDPSVAPLPPLTVAGPGDDFVGQHVAAGLDRRSAVVFGLLGLFDCYGGVLLDAALAPVATLEPEPSDPCSTSTPEAALLSDGRLVVIHEAPAGPLLGVNRLVGQLFGADGEVVGEPFDLDGSPRELLAVTPALGGFLVFSMQPFDVRFPYSSGPLHAQRFSVLGEPLSALVPLGGADGRVDEASVVPVGDGFVLVWTEIGLEFPAANQVHRTWGLRVDAAGQPVGDAQQLLAGVDPARLVPDPVAAPGPGDTVLLAWLEAADGAATLHAQLLTADLAPAGAAATLATHAAPAAGLALAAGPFGEALAVWSSGGELFAQRFAVQRECTPSETVLCLHGGRFEVSVDWADFQGNAGPGRRVPVASDDSGLFWFFHPDNWEMLVKILDGCPVNGHFWVFSAAATNVEYTLTVDDLLAHETRVFRNDLGDTARALTVTNAFPTCGAGGGG